MNGNAISLISRIHEKANRLIIAGLRRNGVCGLSPSHGDILVNLFRYKEMKMLEISKKINRTKATTTVLVDKLESLGFIKRGKSEKDGRYITIALTRKGLEFQPVFEEISKELNETVYRGYTYTEIKIIEMLLEKMNKNLD